VLHRHAEGAEVVGLVADADAEDHAPLGHQIQRDDVLGHADRVMQRQQDDRGAHAQPLRARGYRGGDDQRRGQEAVVVLVVLAEEAGVEAARLGELGLGDRLVDGPIEVLALGGIRDRAVESEFHPYSLISMSS
jgi:hypothetical protein